MSEYHKLLGLKPGASKSMIKSAYRKKALELHPDRNPSQNSEEEFIKVAEAYEVLYNDKKPKKKRARRSQNPRDKYWNVYEPPKDPFEYARWKQVNEERKEFYRNKGRKQARQKYEEFKKDCEAFQKSFFYYPLLILYYSIMGLYTALVASSILIPFFVPYFGEEYENQEMNLTGTLVMMLVIVPIALSLFAILRYIKKAIDPYFYGY